MMFPDTQCDRPDDNFCVFVTPRQLAELNIGLNLADYKDCEDDVQPFVVDLIVEMARRHLLGGSSTSPLDSPYRLPVEKAATCCVTFCLDINGKLCRLNRSELEWPNPLRGLPVVNQVKTFQRLLNEKRINLDDLAVADIDLEVYKQLCVNDVDGDDIWQRTLIQIAKWIVKQKNSKKWGRYFQSYKDSPKLAWWEDMANDIE